MEPAATSLEQGNEILCSTEGGVFIDKLSGCRKRSILDLVSCHLRMLTYTRGAQKVMPPIFFSRELFTQNVCNSRTV
jgi:hypothetical protein